MLSLLKSMSSSFMVAPREGRVQSTDGDPDCRGEIVAALSVENINRLVFAESVPVIQPLAASADFDPVTLRASAACHRRIVGMRVQDYMLETPIIHALALAR
jgi:hypothetical protein